MSVSSPGGTPFASNVSTGSDLSSLAHLDVYDVEFDPALDPKYECPICLSCLREPRQTNCGHRFCRDCILRSLREAGKRCPIDNESLSEDEIYPDNFARREIMNCSVKCPNHRDGCQIKVILSQVKAHLIVCPLALRPCPNNCASILRQKEMKEHLENSCRFRVISCHLCQIEMRASDVADHAMKCAKATILCQYCSNEIKRDEMEFHLREVCQKVVLPCPFHMLGCNHKVERSMEYNHLQENVPLHMKQMSHVMSSLLQQLGDVATKLNRNGIKQNLNNSAVTNGMMSQNLSQMAIGNHQLPPNMSLTSSCSEPAMVPSLGQRSSQGNRTLSMQIEKHNECLNMIDTEGSMSHFSHNNLSGHTPSHPLSHSQSLNHLQRSSCEMLPSRDSRMAAPSAPLTAPVNPGSPFSYASPSLPLQYQSNADPSISNHFSSSNFHNNLLSINNQVPFSASPSPHPANDALTLAGTGLPHSHLPKGEDNIRSFVNMLQELCIRQNRELSQQNRLMENMQRQLSEVQRTNQELVKKVRDLESQSLHHDTRFHCGDFYWHINDFSVLAKKARSNKETTILHSGPFLTGPWGYRLCIRANVSGITNSAHEHFLSLFIHFMQGSNDPFLRWPFKGQIMLSVIDQNEVYSERRNITETLESKPHLEAFRQPTSARNHKGFGFTEFVTLSALEHGSFIRDNAIVIRAHVFPE